MNNMDETHRLTLSKISHTQECILYRCIYMKFKITTVKQEWSPMQRTDWEEDKGPF